MNKVSKLHKEVGEKLKERNRDWKGNKKMINNMLKLEENSIKEKIRRYEIRKNGLSKTCDIVVIVKNLRIKKDEYLADIVLQEEDYTQIFNNCKYSKSLLEKY